MFYNLLELLWWSGWVLLSHSDINHTMFCLYFTTYNPHTVYPLMIRPAYGKKKTRLMKSLWLGKMSFSLFSISGAEKGWFWQFCLWTIYKFVLLFISWNNKKNPTKVSLSNHYTIFIIFNQNISLVFCSVASNAHTFYCFFLCMKKAPTLSFSHR